MTQTPTNSRTPATSVSSQLFPSRKSTLSSSTPDPAHTNQVHPQTRRTQGPQNPQTRERSHALVIAPRHARKGVQQLCRVENPYHDPGRPLPSRPHRVHSDKFCEKESKQQADKRYHLTGRPRESKVREKVICSGQTWWYVQITRPPLPAWRRRPSRAPRQDLRALDRASFAYPWYY